MNLTVAALVAALLTGGPVATSSETTTLHRGPIVKVGKSVACTYASKRVTGKNIANMTLWWYQLNTKWCWDKAMTITSGVNYPSQDSPGPFWEFDGNTTYAQDGGRGSGFWEVTRQGAFHCTFGGLTTHRYPVVKLHMRGGGDVE